MKRIMKNDKKYEMTDVMQNMKNADNDNIRRWQNGIDYETAEFDYNNEHEEDDKNDESDETDNITKKRWTLQQWSRGWTWLNYWTWWQICKNKKEEQQHVNWYDFMSDTR